MARVEEAFFNRSEVVNNLGNHKTAEIPYFVFGAEEEQTAIDEVIATAPDEFMGMYIESIELGERVNESTFKVVVNYKAPTRNSTDEEEETDYSCSFEIGVESLHITHSHETVESKATSGQSPVDYKKAINVDDEGVKGCDIQSPTYHFTERYVFDKSKVTGAYRRNLSRLAGTVNSGSFRDFDEGEVLFLGASGSLRQDGSDKYDITFSFAVQPNVADLQIGNVEAVNKNGWDYAWVVYKNKVDGSGEGKKLLKEPVQVNVERVFKYESFSDLQI